MWMLEIILIVAFIGFVSAVISWVFEDISLAYAAVFATLVFGGWALNIAYYAIKHPGGFMKRLAALVCGVGTGAVATYVVARLYNESFGQPSELIQIATFVLWIAISWTLSSRLIDRVERNESESKENEPLKKDL